LLSSGAIYFEAGCLTFLVFERYQLPFPRLVHILLVLISLVLFANNNRLLLDLEPFRHGSLYSQSLTSILNLVKNCSNGFFSCCTILWNLIVTSKNIIWFGLYI
jgi:hypothetical protein